MNVTEKDVLLCKAMAHVARATYTIQGFRGKQDGVRKLVEMLDARAK